GWADGDGTSAYINNSKSTAQITYEQIAALCGDDVSTWGARMQFEASGAWEVFSVKVGQQAPVYAVAGAVEFEGAACTGDGWSQNGTDMTEAVLAALVPGSIVEISYTSENGDLWIVMPDAAAGWMRVGWADGDGTPAVTDGSTCYVTYEQIAALCGDDITTWGARMQFEASGAWEVYGVKVGKAAEMKMVNELVAFDGAACTGDGWSQNGTDMPEAVLAALVPGSVVTISYTSENGDLWIVMPDAAAGWMRVGWADGDGTSAYINNSKSTAQITYEQIAALCGDDVSTWGARMQFEASGAWEVYSVSVGMAN
ncbi:MAG: hypothetical protein ACI4SE_03980, partial [Lachnospiraceae bacterium]